MEIEGKIGKIYVIRSPNTEKIYIGSTNEKYLCDRMYHHRSIKNSCSSKQIIEKGNAYIELLENYKYTTKDEMKRREGELIRLNKENCINKYMAGRTYEEYNIFRKEERKKKKEEDIKKKNQEK